MKAFCPNCGAEVEFRYDDSFVRVCGHCRNTLLRTDRSIESLGQVADLTPIESPLRLFASGSYGTGTFLLVGMAQLRHAGGGIWQEWYGKFDGGQWGWLAEAQGRYYLTFEQTGVQLPPRSWLAPGAQLALPVNGAPRLFTVGEVGTASYVTATGELPFRLEPGRPFSFGDLSDGAGNFATIDYGDGSEPPTLYLGQQLTLADLRIHGGEQPIAPTPTLSTARLACPSCNGTVELRAPGETLRLVCAYCNTLLDTSAGQLQILEQLATKPTPTIPLGTTGQFLDGELTVIGYVRRSACIDDEWWPFDEYLLHHRDVGFRWLVSSDGHWSYVQPIAPGAVERVGSGARYDGVSFATYQRSPLRVDQVLGELYWRVTVGERVDAEDFIAPPAMVSCERSDSEETWSLSTYLTRSEVQAAVGNNIQVPPSDGFGANQPNSLDGVSKVLGLGLIMLLLAGFGFAVTSSVKEKARVSVVLAPATRTVDWSSSSDPANPPAEPAGNVQFSDPFSLDGGKNIEIDLAATGLANNWAYVMIDLVNEQTGQLVSADGSMESYSGVEDGESWSEGDPRTVVYLGPQPAGTYVLRFEGQQGGSTDLAVSAVVKQGVFRGKYLLWALGILAIPMGLIGGISYARERSRWENSNTGKPPVKLTMLPLLVVGAVFVVAWALIKAMLSNDDSD